MARLWRDYSLSLVLAAIFLVTLALATAAGWMEFSGSQRAHGQQPQLLGDDGYLPFASEQIFQNWQSEFLALGLTIALSARFIHRGSSQSRDGRDELARKIKETERRVNELVAGRS